MSLSVSHSLSKERQMNATQLKDTLTKAFKARLPVLIKGAPGIGKTDIITQAAEAAEMDLHIFHPVVSDPTDFKGLPAIVNDKAEFLPYGDLRLLLTAKRPTVAFLDDLGQAPPVVQASVMQLLLARKINGHAVSKHVVFAAATNRREDKAGVTSILEPVKSRFASIVELTVDVDEWCKWAITNDMPPELIAFVRFRPALMTSPTAATNDIVNRACPRTVANVGKLLKAGLDNAEVLAGAVGEGFAAEFIGFMRIWQTLPNIDAILLSPESAKVPTEVAALYAIATVLAEKTTVDNAPRVMRYANRMPKEFATLCIRDALGRCPEAANNKDFIRWATENQDVLN